MKTLLLLIGIYFSINADAQEAEKLVVHFAFNKSNLEPEARMQLDSLLRTNKNRFNFTSIELGAHCDSIGNNPYNDRLSLMRARAVKNYLLATGIDSSVFTKVSGFGKRQPLNENANDEERFLNRRVELTVNKVAYVSNSTLPGEKKISELIRDSSTKIGTTIILRNLNFQGGRHILLTRSLPILTDLVKAMEENPNLKIEIQGHVCCTANYLDGRDNDLGTYDLSWQRAKVIYEYMVEYKINPNRMSFKGFGGSRKLYPYERDEYEREENRRVEIKIVEK